MVKLKLIVFVITVLVNFGFTAENRESFFYDNLELKGVAVREPGYHVWGSSPIIGPEGKVHLFCARWPNNIHKSRRTSFGQGWKSHSEVAHYVSDSPEGPFTFVDVVLKGTGRNTWDHRAIHNPTVHKVGEKYYIFYIANKSKQGFPANQRIGLASADSLYGPWERVGKDGLLLSPSEDSNNFTYQSVVGINNPTYLQHPNGKHFLYFKVKRSKAERRQIGVAIADNVEGPYVIHPGTVVDNVTLGMGIEDGYAFTYNNKIYIIATGGFNDIKFHGGILWYSEDGMSFKTPLKGFNSLRHHLGVTDLAPEAMAYYQSLQAAKFERPQVLMVDGVPAYMYAPSGTNPEGGDGTISFVFKIFGIPPKTEAE